MIPLATRLDDTDFDALVELARARLPALAPEWTDYNIHDPGIMLVELLAWVADSQIYSLSRNRRDERLAMGRLLGVSPRAAVPASGVLHAAETPAAVQQLGAGSRVVSVTGAAPRFETLHDVTLVPLRLTAVRTEAPGVSTDHTAANARAGVTFPAFGAPAVEGAALRLELTPDAALPAQTLRLAIGIEVAGERGGAAPRPGELGGLEAVRAETGLPLKQVFDSTLALQRSGVLILEAPPDGAAGLTLLLRPTGGYARSPRLSRVSVNALPVAQQATIPTQRFAGQGRAGQVVSVNPTELCEGDAEAAGRVWRLVEGADALQVEVREGGAFVAWRRGALDDAGPGDRIYEVAEQADGQRLALRFGNGVNGRRPGLGETIEITRLRLSCGAAGSVASQLDWRADGTRARFENAAPLDGGQDPQDIAGLLFAVREKLRTERVLATSKHVREAVEALPAAFGVDRIEIEEGWERGRRAPRTPATRTLIVTRRGQAGETPQWRRAIARRLRPRIAIGERLLVEAPVRRPFGVRAQVRLVPGRAPGEVDAAIRRDLDVRFANVPGAETPWPLGRDVDATALGGWIRRVPGVAFVASATLLDVDGAPCDRIEVRRGELPKLSGPVELTITAAEARL